MHGRRPGYMCGLKGKCRSLLEHQSLSPPLLPGIHKEPRPIFMSKSKKSEKQQQRDRVKKLFPDAIEFMEKVLKDKVRSRSGDRRVAVTSKQRLDVALWIANQSVGRAIQAPTTAGETEQTPVHTLEVIKTYEDAEQAVLDAAPGDLIPVPDDLDESSRVDWLKRIEEEALADSGVG
jgi:hypothetical protein